MMLPALLCVHVCVLAAALLMCVLLRIVEVTDASVTMQLLSMGALKATKGVGMETFVKSWRLYKGKTTQRLPGYIEIYLLL